MTRGDVPGLGADGLRVTGLGAGHDLLAAVPEYLPPLHLAYREGPRGFETSSVGDERVTFALEDGRGLAVERETACATYSGHRRPTGRTWSIPSSLRRRRQWGGGRATSCSMPRVSWPEAGYGAYSATGEAGKSTVAAWLAQKGYAVVCDDMLAISGRTAFAGPRCVDLRPEPARRLGMGQPADGTGWP